jgi:hypothetical protein
MKKYLLFLFSFLFFLFIFSGIASAHVLKSDGSVGAILHVSPDDDPIAGVQTDFFFEIKDKENKFTPENCDCTATVFQNGKEIYSQPLFQNNNNPSLENASFSYVLPQKDVYKIQISGKSVTAGAFEHFTLTWDIRVARDEAGQTAATNNPFTLMLPYIIVLAAVLVFVGVLLSKKKKPQKSR